MGSHSSLFGGEVKAGRLAAGLGEPSSGRNDTLFFSPGLLGVFGVCGALEVSRIADGAIVPPVGGAR